MVPILALDHKSGGVCLLGYDHKKINIWAVGNITAS
jgi:hypothetical protein